MSMDNVLKGLSEFDAEGPWACALKEIELLREENERLRTALKLAAEWGVDSDMGGKNPVSAALRHWIKGGMYGPLTTEQKGGMDHQTFEQNLPEPLKSIVTALKLVATPWGDGILLRDGFAPIATMTRQEAANLSAHDLQAIRDRVAIGRKTP